MVTAINKFEIGDIFQLNLGTIEEPNWIKFFNFPLRDNGDIEFARKIFETHGACLGPASASLSNSPAYRQDFRAITDPEWAVEIWAAYHNKQDVDHFYTKAGRLIGPRGDYA